MTVRTSTALPSRRALTPMVAAGVAVFVLAAGCGRTGDPGTAAGPSPAAGAGATGAKTTHIKGPPDGAKPLDGGKLVMAIEADAEGLDPTRFAFGASGHFIASAVFDPLATQDADGKAVPYMASDIKGTDNNKTWTITIPAGLTFSDGDPLDADVVLANFQAHQKSYITKAALVNVTSVEKTSPTQVVVTLSKPWRRSSR